MFAIQTVAIIISCPLCNGLPYFHSIYCLCNILQGSGITPIQSSLFNNHCQAELRNNPLLFLQPFEHTITPHFTLLKTLFLPLNCQLYENMCYFLILQTYIPTYSPPSFSILLYLLQIFKNEQLKHCLPPPPTRGNFYPILGIYHSHAGLYTFVTHTCMKKYYSVTCFQHYLP